jgi:hypothetical protein
MNPTLAIEQAQLIFDQTLTDKETIDELLHLDAQLYHNLGIESSKTDKDKVKKASAFIYRLIKLLDVDKGQRLLLAMGLTR